MSPPRPVFPGTTYLITRSASQGQFLLRPSKLSDQIILFVLAVAARRYGIRIHLYCFLSNHFHLLLTDPGTNLPAFMQFFDAFVARALNTLLDRDENVWAPGSYSAVTLSTPQDVLAKAVYLLANPVSAGLVRFAHLWPGLWSSPQLVEGAPIVVERPDRFFARTGSFPERVELQLRAPAGFGSAEEFRALAQAGLEAREAEEARHRTGFLGPLRVLRQRPTDRPRKMRPRGELNPRVAAKNKWRRIELLGRLVGFLRDYHAAWLEWAAGARAVVFPAGTYLMRVRHGAACAGAG